MYVKWITGRHRKQWVSQRGVIWSDWISFCQKCCFSAEDMFGSPQRCTEKKRGTEWRLSEGERERLSELPPAGSVWDLGPRGPLDGSHWMGALARWPGSLRAGYEGKGMLLLCVWPPDPLSNVCLGCFETQHIYLRRSEERGWSGCQNKVIVLLTASSSVEGQLWQAHNVAAPASPGRRTVICGHAGNLPSLHCSQAPLIQQNYFLGPVRNVFYLSVQGCRQGNMWEPPLLGFREAFVGFIIKKEGKHQAVTHSRHA